MHEAAERIDYFFHKDRLTRGWSYPLKRSRLDQALVESGASNVASVFYSLVMTPLARRDNGPVAVVYRGEAMPSTHPGEVSIFVQSVPSVERAIVAKGLEKVLTGVARWIAGSKQREPTWRTEDHRLFVTIADGEPTVREEPR